MNPDEFERQLRAGETYHAIKLPPQRHTVIRVDGRCFTALTDAHYDRPFDEHFHRAMVNVARALLVDFGGVMATAHSDEVSLLLPRDWDMFDREVEKAVSVAAGIASAFFTQYSERRGVFDGRAWVGATDQQVIDYMRWRQADSLRGALNSMCYWKLRQNGHTVRQATAKLHGQGVSFKNELLMEHGVNFNDTPLWQRRGTVLYWGSYTKVGHNPLTGADVSVDRRRIVEDGEPPAGEAYDALIWQVMGVQS